MSRADFLVAQHTAVLDVRGIALVFVRRHHAPRWVDEWGADAVVDAGDGFTETDDGSSRPRAP